MTDSFWEEVRTLFHDVADRATDARADLLAGADPLVRAEVESLLAAHDEPTPFMEQSVWQLIDAQQTVVRARCRSRTSYTSFCRCAGRSSTRVAC